MESFLLMILDVHRPCVLFAFLNGINVGKRMNINKFLTIKI